jgi:LPXTG-motif cell wall-anchored protein
MKVRTTIAGAGLSAVLSVVGCGAMTIFVSAAVSACSGPSTTTPDAGSTTPTFTSEAATSPNPGVTTETVTANPTTPATSNPTASPVTAAPATGGGGTAGTQDALLFVVGGAAVLAGGASLAYRRKVNKNR